MLLMPVQCSYIATLSCQKLRAQTGQVILLYQQAFGIFFLNRPYGCGCGKHDLYLVFRDDAPEGSGIGCHNRLALKNHCGIAVQQWSVYDITVTDNPAYIRSSPEDFSRLRPIDMGHGEL
ncbi:hypothetical protein D9M68_914750 [compost metagenome]